MGKKKSKKQKRPRYESIGEFLNPESALCQAALLLDEAAHQAIQSNDNAAMQGVSRGWMELGAVLHNISVASGEEEFDEDEAEDVTSETRIMGFRQEKQREVLENAYKS